MPESRGSPGLSVVGVEFSRSRPSIPRSVLDDMTHVLLRRVTNVFDEYVYRNAQTLDSVTVFVPGGIQRRRRLG